MKQAVLIGITSVGGAEYIINTRYIVGLRAKKIDGQDVTGVMFPGMSIDAREPVHEILQRWRRSEME